MPKSKRNRLIHTSRVEKRPSKEKSASLFSAIRAALDSCQNVFAFSVSNMRNTYLKSIREEFRDSRIFFGKTKVMAKALGTSGEDEYQSGLSGLSEYLKGDVGLLCTNREVEGVLEFFSEYTETDFARAGTIAPRTFTVPEGVIYSTAGEQPAEDDVALPHSLEQQVRKWGMPTRLEKGKVMLDQEYVLCEEGKVLNSNQTALLKTFGVVMAEFKVQVLAYWTAASQEVTEVDSEAMVEG